MRYAEIICEQSLLEEGFLDTLTKALANTVARPFRIVNNATSALMVIKDVISDAKRCESVCFLLRKQIIRFIKSLPKTIGDALWRVVPRGYTVADFLGMIILLPAATFIADKVKGLAGDTIEDGISNLVNRLTNLKSLASGLLSAGAQSIFGVFQTLGLADDLLFQTLSAIHQKIKVAAPNA